MKLRPIKPRCTCPKCTGGKQQPKANALLLAMIKASRKEVKK